MPSWQLIDKESKSTLPAWPFFWPEKFIYKWYFYFKLNKQKNK